MWFKLHRFAVVSVLSLGVFFLAFSALGLQTAFAQLGYVTGPGAPGPFPSPLGGTTGGTLGPGGLITNYKTPQLSAGQSVSIPITVHNSSGAVLPNWAGVLVEVHLIDPSEVDITAVRVGGAPVPHPFPTSGGPGSTAAIFTVFHPAIFGSGIALQPSSSFPTITLDLVAKNTNPINNSDIDIGLRFADIYHQPGFTLVRQVTNPGPPIHRVAIAGSTTFLIPVPGSTTWHWADSHRVLVPSSIPDMAGLHLTGGGHQANSNQPFPHANPSQNNFESKFVIPRGVNPETGHFIHFPAGIVHRVASSVVGHRLGNSASSTMIPQGGVISTITAFIPGSQIIAMPFLATASIGLEHVPEPAASLLLLAGLASLAIGSRARRQRRRLT
jgi:hypothetical protein